LGDLPVYRSGAQAPDQANTLMSVMVVFLPVRADPRMA
jgi:hypothetical protein